MISSAIILPSFDWNLIAFILEKAQPYVAIRSIKLLKNDNNIGLILFNFLHYCKKIKDEWFILVVHVNNKWTLPSTQTTSIVSELYNLTNIDFSHIKFNIMMKFYYRKNNYHTIYYPSFIRINLNKLINDNKKSKIIEHKFIHK